MTLISPTLLLAS